MRNITICFTFLIASVSIYSLECKPNKSYIDQNEPRIFNTTNNLLRLPGEEPIFCGDKLTLNISLVDSNCVPISDAKLYIWQVACDKKYPYKPLKKKPNPQMFNLKNNISTFLGSGSVVTNNLGIGQFITIYPPAIDKLGSHINLRVFHPQLGTFQTKIMLDDYDMSDTGIMHVTIVAPWKNIFRKY